MDDSARPLYRYWLEVLCDDGVSHGAAVEATTPARAAQPAFDNAIEQGLSPVQIDSVTDNDSGAILWDRDTDSGSWYPQYDKPYAPPPVGASFRNTVNGQIKDTHTGLVYEGDHELFDSFEWPYHNIFLP